MPSLYPVGFFGLAMAALLSRLGWKEGFIHLIALPVGAAASLGQIFSVLPGHYPWDRYDVLHEHMAGWFHAAFYGGSSSDELPFIVLVVPSVWLAAYLSAWAVFRWRNAWLALVPAGVVLLTNIAFLPGQSNLTLVIFLVGGTVLVTRLHVVGRAKAWRDDGTPYPPLISLSVLHASLWAAAALVVLALLMPKAHESSALASVWARATAPLSDRVASLGRLFYGVSNKGNLHVHGFGSDMPFLGSIELSNAHVLDAQTGKELADPAFLRAQAYYYYSASGWSAGDAQAMVMQNDESIGAAQAAEREQQALTIISGGETGSTLFTLGQPLRADRTARYGYQLGSWPQDVTGVKSTKTLGAGATYRTVGSTSIATEDNLRAAGSDYPAWVNPYLQLPPDFSPRVRAFALGIAASQPTAYDRAVAFERYLRTNYPYDLKLPSVPYGRDPIEYFLFDSKRGYFDYHASAMVVLLRAVGVPARLAVGYALESGQYDPQTGSYHVTEASAYAWPEVYFPGYGWVDFNPTPDLPSIVRPGGVGAAAIPNGGDEAAQSPDLSGLPNNLAQQGETSPAALTSASSTGRTQWVVFGIAAAMAVLFTSLVSGAGYVWLRGLSALDEPARLWEQTVRLASWARLAPSPNQTPREYAGSLRERLDGLDDVDVLAGAYVRHQFGHHAIARAERDRLDLAWRSVRGRLLRRLFRLR